MDLGCGEGDFTKRLSYESWVGPICGAEISKYASKICYKKGVKTVLFDGKNLPFKYDTFDLIIMREVYEHIAFSDKMDVLFEIRRVLKNQGYLVITTPNKWDITRFLYRLKGEPWYAFTDETHVGLTTPLGLKDNLKKSNFTVILLSSIGIELPSLGIRFRLINSGFNKLFIPRYILQGLVAIARKE